MSEVADFTAMMSKRGRRSMGEQVASQQILQRRNLNEKCS